MGRWVLCGEMGAVRAEGCCVERVLCVEGEGCYVGEKGAMWGEKGAMWGEKGAMWGEKGAM